MTAVLALARAGPAVLTVQAAKTFVMVVFLIVAFRLTGKREVSQLTVYDLAMLMALSNAVQNAMTAGRGNLGVGLVSSTVVVVVAWALTRGLTYRPSWDRLVLGTPSLLAYDGRVLAGEMRRERITQSELDEAIREHGIKGIADVFMAVLEVDGSISVLPKEDRLEEPDR